MPDLATQIRELIEGSAPPVTLDEVKGRVHVLEDADPIGWQIRELIEGSAPPITLDEVKGRVRTPHRSNRSRTAGRHRSRRLALAVSIPLVLAMIGLSTFLAPGSTPPAAAAVLEQASSVAAALPAATPPGPGQYLYFTSTQEVLESLSPPHQAAADHAAGDDDDPDVGGHRRKWSPGRHVRTLGSAPRQRRCRVGGRRIAPAISSGVDRHDVPDVQRALLKWSYQP
jgi:hypothetical protein